MISFLFYSLGASLARRLPPDFSGSITNILAWSQYYLRIRSRRNVIRNLRIVMGEGTGEVVVRRTARLVFRNFGRSIYSFLRLPCTLPEELVTRCDFGGIDRVVRKLSQEGGFIIAGPHVGAWEVAGASLSAVGLRIHTVALDHPSASVTRFFEERRRMLGIVCHPIGKSFAVLSEALERGGCVALLIDRTFGRSRRSFSLFGRPVALPTGHAALAVRCGVPIVTAACVFASGDRFKFVFNGPHYPDRSLGEDAAVHQLHERCRVDMERLIREYPDQWFNFRELSRGDQCLESSTT